MTETTEALYRFFGGFGMPVYPEGGAPATAEPPYITVKMMDPGWRETATFYARIWERSASKAGVLAKADAIGAAIGEGVSIPTAHGCVVIGKGAPFAQLMPYAGDAALHCAYLSMTMQALVG